MRIEVYNEGNIRSIITCIIDKLRYASKGNPDWL